MVTPSSLKPPSPWHWAEYACECFGTAFLVFAGLSAVVFDFGTGLPMAHWIPNASLRLLLTGLLFAGSGSLVAISPLGKLSGGHINPAVSLAFWLHGKMHRCDLLGYIAGQFLGGILGAGALVLLWGNYATSVTNGMTIPNPADPFWLVFIVETGMTFTLVLSIFIFVSQQRLMKWTPLMTWILVALLVWGFAPISGTSLNPARSFGPALLTGIWKGQWLYFIAPPLGAIVAVGIFRLFQNGLTDVQTGKLFHSWHYPSIFKNVSQPAIQKEPS